MSENENYSQSDLAKIVLSLEHDIRLPIYAIRSRISQSKRKSESNLAMEAFEEINQWLTEIEFQITIASVFLRSDIFLNIKRTDLCSVLHEAIKYVKYRTSKDFFFNNKIIEMPLFWIDAFLFQFVFIFLLKYLLDDENDVSQKMAIEVSSEKSLSDFKVIRFCLITRKSTKCQNDKFSSQLEVAKRILIAHGGNLQIEKPFQKVSIHLPNSLTQKYKPLEIAE